MKPRLLIALIFTGLLAGCQTFGNNVPKPATADLQPSNQPALATAAGIAGGGLIGGTLGASVTPSDRQKGLDAEYKALEYGKGGEVVEWAGSAGVSGKVRAAQPYRVGSQDCRQYSHDLVSAGAVSSAKATACRNSDGSWTLLE